MKARLGFVSLLAILILLCACDVSDEKNASVVTREQAIQTIRTIGESLGDAEVHSNPKMDQVVNNVRYYFVQAVYANKMAAAYYVDEKEGNVFIAAGGELDTQNPLLNKSAEKTASSDAQCEASQEVAAITEEQAADLADILGAIGMTHEQVVDTFGSDYKALSVNYHGQMEALFYSERGITVAFGSDGQVARVYCTEKIDIDGARPGMDFSQIQEILGETSFRQTWVETPTNTAYEIRYRLNDRTVSFFSRQMDGGNSIMSIS